MQNGLSSCRGVTKEVSEHVSSSRRNEMGFSLSCERLCELCPELLGCNLHARFGIKISTLWSEQLLSIQALHFTFQQCLSATLQLRPIL